MTRKYINPLAARKILNEVGMFARPYGYKVLDIIVFSQNYGSVHAPRRC